MSDSVEELYQKLLDSGFSEAELEKQVQNKAKEFGGFMSERGVLFVIAKEKGVQLRSPDIDQQLYETLEEEFDYDDFTVDISEVKESMSNIVLLGKVIKVFPSREFTRKDGSMGAVCSFLLGDSTKSVKIVLWLIRIKRFKYTEMNNMIGQYKFFDNFV